MMRYSSRLVTRPATGRSSFLYQSGTESRKMPVSSDWFSSCCAWSGGLRRSQNLCWSCGNFFFIISTSFEYLQELSVELDGRREEQVSLAASGQRLINTLSDGSGQQPGSGTDDALMLRRRLDDMNRRWHGLRAKTVAIRCVLTTS